MSFTRNFKSVARIHKFEHLKNNKVEYFRLATMKKSSLGIFSKTIYCNLNRILSQDSMHKGQGLTAQQKKL